jgi:DNA replication ATP-dependent helicase Dna2
MLFLFYSQLVKKKIWRSHSLKHDKSTSFLSSLVLDASDELPHQKSLKENRFIYRFVYRDLTSFNVKASDRDSSTVATSPTSDMDCTLKSGDYVVHLFSCIDLCMMSF